MSKNITTEIFIERSKLTHGDKYDYSKVKYLGKDTKVEIICPKHGSFFQSPSNHYRHGCPKCGVEIVSNSKYKTTKQFIEKAKSVHGDKYDYSKSKYINSKTPLIVICPIHGEVSVKPHQHIIGSGCPECGKKLKGQYKKSNTEEFIKKAKNIHGNKYNYDKVKYILSNKKVIINCPIHGDFEQTPNHHLNGQGCPICKSSKGELLVRKILEKYNINYIPEVTFHVNEIVKNKKEFRIDFVIEKDNHIYFIEYNGRQHYEASEHFGGEEEFKLQQKRDQYVRGFVYRNKEKLSLLEIPHKWKESTVESKIINFLNIVPIDSNINSKSGELLESCDANQQPSTELTSCEGSETNS